MGLWLKRLSVGLLVLLMAGCSTMDVRDFQGTRPAFNPMEFFEGEVRAWGTFEGRGGDVKRQFKATFKGERSGDELTINEIIRYKNGDTETRRWTISRVSDHAYDFHSEQIHSSPARANVYGNALHLNYVLDVETAEGSTWSLRFDDWMFLQDNRTLINRARVSKYGFTVGNVHIFYRKQGPVKN